MALDISAKTISTCIADYAPAEAARILAAKWIFRDKHVDTQAFASSKKVMQFFREFNIYSAMYTESCFRYKIDLLACIRGYVMNCCSDEYETILNVYQYFCAAFGRESFSGENFWSSAIVPGCKWIGYGYLRPSCVYIPEVNLGGKTCIGECPNEADQKQFAERLRDYNECARLIPQNDVPSWETDISKFVSYPSWDCYTYFPKDDSLISAEIARMLKEAGVIVTKEMIHHARQDGKKAVIEIIG